VAQQHRAQPSALLGDGLVTAPLQLGFDLGQLGPEPLRDCPPFDPKRAFPRLPTQVRKAQEMKGFRFPQSLLLTSPPGEATPLNQARLDWMQLPAKVSNTLGQGLQEPLGVLTLFEPYDDVVNIPGQANIPLTISLTPLVSP
jgi:hypothetical protein